MCISVQCSYSTSVICRFSSFQNATYAATLSSRLLMTVYKGIAPGEDRKALPSLDVNSKRLADGLLQLAFSLSQQVSAAVKRSTGSSSLIGHHCQTTSSIQPVYLLDWLRVTLHPSCTFVVKLLFDLPLDLLYATSDLSILQPSLRRYTTADAVCPGCFCNILISATFSVTFSLNHRCQTLAQGPNLARTEILYTY